VSRLALIALVVSGAASGGCHGGAVSQAQGPHDAVELVRHMSIGHTTAAEIEREFGAADERPPDGSLVYRFDRRRDQKVGAGPETETVTLRFERGVLSKICRTRS
jgi:hypothetical protein